MKYELIKQRPYTYNTGRFIDLNPNQEQRGINRKLKEVRVSSTGIRWDDAMIIDGEIYALYGYKGRKFVAELRRV